LPRFIHKFKATLSRKKIRTQLIIVFFCAGLLPIFIVGSYLLINNRNLVLKQHTALTSAYNLRTKSVVLDITTSISNMSDDIFSDTAIESLLSEKYSTAEEVHDACRSYTKIDNYANNYVEISDINVYVNNPTMINYGHFIMASPECKNSTWYQLAANSFIPHWLTWSYLDKYGNRIVQLRLVRKIPVISANSFAVLVIDVNNNHLKSRIRADPLDAVVTVNSDPTFFSSKSEYMFKPMSTLLDNDPDSSDFSGIFSLNGVNRLLDASTLTLINSADKLHIMTIDNDALPNMKSILINCLIIVLFSMLVPLLLIVFFSRTFSARVNTLRHEMHKVGQGNYDIIKSFNGNDELVDLFADLKTMIENIKIRDQEIYSDKIIKQKLINHQQKMEFEMLSSQINPHFLYNTLESIRMNAYVAGNLEVANAIKLLGKSMRHVLETSGSAVSLQSELEYVRIYLQIQKIRFKDRINYEFHVDDAIDREGYKMLPLLLQPIVENAMIHGLEEKGSGGLIGISITCTEDKLLIIVSDNGCGMTTEKLRVLLDEFHAGKERAGSSIGLHNIQRRLIMFYGEDYGLTISSQPDVGTKVTISLPLHWKEDEYESFNC